MSKTYDPNDEDLRYRQRVMIKKIDVGQKTTKISNYHSLIPYHKFMGRRKFEKL